MRGFIKVFCVAAYAAAMSAQGAAAHPLSAFEPLDTAPYRLGYQGWYTVNATVNGDEPNDFIVDSGATITSVFANLAARQNFPPADRGPIRIFGLSDTEELPAYRIGEVIVGKTRLEDHIGVVLPDWAPPNTPPQGVLGLDLLRRYTVMFDSEVNEIRFYDPRADFHHRDSRGWSRTRLIPIYVADQITPIYRIDVKINALRVPCVIDLGASGTLFNGPAIRAMNTGVRVNSQGLRGSSTATRLNDVFDTAERARLVKISVLKIGRAKWRDSTALVHDAAIFKELGFSRKPFCLVGADMLRDRSFIFDFANEEFYVGPPIK